MLGSLDRLPDPDGPAAHGPDRKGMEQKTKKIWNKVMDPRDNEIEQLEWMIRDLTSRGVNTFLNVNNHYEGSAPLTIERFMKKMNG